MIDEGHPTPRALTRGRGPGRRLFFEETHGFKPISLNAFLQAPLYHEVGRFAEKEGISRAEVVRRALELYLEEMRT